MEFVQKLKEYAKSRKGQAGQAVVGVGVTAILIFIIILVTSYVTDALPLLTGTANTTFESIEENAYSAYDLLGVALIVGASAVILGYVYTFMRR